MKSYEALILGGGCSGLSLAMAAANSSRIFGQVAVLESKASYHDDRTWCFWDVSPHPHEDLIKHRWNRWRVSNSSKDVICKGVTYDYCQIRSGDFYDKAQRVIGESQNCELLKDTAVISLSRCPGGWEVLTNQGKFLAPLVFDARPPNPVTKEEQTFSQHFLGWRIEFSTDCLELDTAVLMDFQPVDNEGIHFVYLIPETRRTALVESTFLGGSLLGVEVYEENLKTYVQHLSKGTNYRILSREFGVIPMHPQSQTENQQHGLIEIGARAGCIKSSSGYGFLNIQRHTQAIIAQWEKGQTVVSPQARSPWISWLDRVFLNWLRAHPEKAPQMFYDLFSKVPADNLVRFLSEQPSLFDSLKVILAMPRWEFLSAAISMKPAAQTG